MPQITEAPNIKVRGKKRRWKLRLILLLFVFPAVVLAGYTWLTLHYAYSTGERTGYVKKISKKGWPCKTWEGELAVATVPGTAPEIFQFSVRDEATASRIQQTAGQRVALAYQQHRGVPSTCFGDTEYYIVGVRTIGP